MVSSYEGAFQRKLVARIVARNTEKTDQIANGSAASGTQGIVGLPFEYGKRVGYLEAMSDVLKLCEIVFDELNKGE